MRVKRMVWASLVALAALSWTASAAQADLLSTLIPGGSITCGDKLFSSFTYSPTGDMPTASGVSVTCVTIDGNIGIVFEGTFQDLTTSAGASDALITYTVTVTDPTKLIIDAHLSGSLDVTGAGAVAVTETFLPDSNNQMSIFNFNFGTPTTQLSDSTNFATGFTTLHVQKDILAFAVTGTATITSVDQTFSQTTPEPGTLVLLGAGLLGLFGYASWRRRV